jgi:hypothetical protein
MSRYAPLTACLKDRPANLVRLSLADIERISDRKLHESVSTHRAGWSNNAANNVMARAWLAAGFQSEQVDLPGRTPVFLRKKEGEGMSGVQQAQVTFEPEGSGPSNKLALFGWMKGTITVAPGGFCRALAC